MTAPDSSLACSGPLMRRIAVLAAGVLMLVPAAATAQDRELMVKRLTSQMRLAGGFASAYVADVSAPSAQPVFRWREHAARILASNTKLFTTTAALARFGTEGTLGTEVLGTGELDAEGVYRGSLYLRGGGDPTFGSRPFTQRSNTGGVLMADRPGYRGPRSGRVSRRVS